MQKRYAIFTTTGTRFDSGVVFYSLSFEQFINCSSLVDSVTLEEAIDICKSTQISTWIVEQKYPILKELIQSHRRCFNDFIDNCKKSGLELIETRPSIFSTSIVEPKVEIETTKKEYGYIIKRDCDNAYVCGPNSIKNSYYINHSINSKGIVYYRTRKEANFQCKIMKLKYHREYSVVKIDLNEHFK